MTVLAQSGAGLGLDHPRDPVVSLEDAGCLGQHTSAIALGDGAVRAAHHDLDG